MDDEVARRGRPGRCRGSSGPRASPRRRARRSGRPRAGWSRTSRGRCPVRRRRSRSAGRAAGRSHAVSSGIRTPRHGVTTRRRHRAMRRRRRGRGRRGSRDGVRRTAAGPTATGSRGSGAHGRHQRVRELGDVPRCSGPVPRRTANACASSASMAAAVDQRDDRPEHATDPELHRRRRRARPGRGHSRDRAGRRGRRRARTGTARAARPVSGSAHSSASRSARPAGGRRDRRNAGTPSRCGSARGCACGSRPVASRAASTSEESDEPAPGSARSWRLARDVRWMRPSPYASATSTRGRSDAVDTDRRSGGAGRACRPRRTTAENARAEVAASASRTLFGADLVRARARGRADLAAIAARASRSSDSGSIGPGRLPGDGPPVAAPPGEAACSARHPHRCASVPDSHRVP